VKVTPPWNKVVKLWSFVVGLLLIPHMVKLHWRINTAIIYPILMFGM
jgi:hypothetical protein